MRWPSRPALLLTLLLALMAVPTRHLAAAVLMAVRTGLAVPVPRAAAMLAVRGAAGLMAVRAGLAVPVPWVAARVLVLVRVPVPVRLVQCGRAAKAVSPARLPWAAAPVLVPVLAAGLTKVAWLHCLGRPAWAVAGLTKVAWLRCLGLPAWAVAGLTKVAWLRCLDPLAWMVAPLRAAVLMAVRVPIPSRSFRSRRLLSSQWRLIKRPSRRSWDCCSSKA
jgi:hypothetical protein